MTSVLLELNKEGITVEKNRGYIISAIRISWLLREKGIRKT